MGPQIPARLQVVSSFPFVGRDRELAALRALVPRLPGETLRVAVLGGEAGSGKSRLVRELAQEVAEGGLLVLSGGCDPAVRTPFGPVVEVLTQLAGAIGHEALRADLGSTGGELVRLLPGLRLELAGLATPIETDPDTGRHRLLTAVADLLDNTSRRRPLVVVLEDLHWADGPTLLLLGHLVRSATTARILVLATFRNVEAEVPADLVELLADLQRSDRVVRVTLSGLSEEGVEEFVRRSAAGDLPERARLEADAVLVRSMLQLTEGNPFLLCELWRTLAASGAVAVSDGAVTLTRPLSEIATPTSVRDVVQQRLSGLPASARGVVELAAVIGSEFDFELLRQAAGPDLDLAGGLEAALRAGMIDEVPSQVLAYRFAHELVRQAVYERLSRLRRAELHLQVAEALESLGPDRSGQQLASLAHHYTAAVPLGARERAIEYNLQAARAAAGAAAFGEAAMRLRTAVSLEEAQGPRRAELLMALGHELYRAGNSTDSLVAYREVAAIARRLGDAALLARAAIGFCDACARPGLDDLGAVALLEEAWQQLPEDDSALRVQLLASLIYGNSRLHGDDSRGRDLRQAAIAMARRLDDRAGLATILTYSYWSDLDRREVQRMLDEARELAAELGDIDLEADAMAWRVATHLVLGDTAAAQAELAVLHEMVARTHQPFYLHVAEHDASALALLTGDLDEARSAAERSREWGRLLTGRDASSVYGIQMFGVLREQGRLEEFAPALRVLAGRDGAWEPGLAAMLAEIGMEDEARSLLSRIAQRGLGAFRQSLWLLSLTYLADAAAAVGDAAVARQVYPELTPLVGAPVVIGHGIACYGAADRYLGMLAAAFGDVEAAERHFEAALALNRSMGARTWLAHTAYHYARMLLTTGSRRRAEPLLREARTIAESVGLKALLSRIAGLAGETGAVSADVPDGLSWREIEILRLLAQGRTNRQIGTALFISQHTVANHVRSILTKTGAANRTEAAAYAFQRGLASWPFGG